MTYEHLQTLDTLASLITAFAALGAMWKVGHQEWRSPADMHARRIVLAVLAGVAMCHVLQPSWIPEIAQQFALAALLIMIAIGNAHRDAWHRPYTERRSVGEK